MTPKISHSTPPSAYIRTDLACEAAVPVVSVEDRALSAVSRPVTLTRCREAEGGRSVTISLGRITERGESELPDLSRLLACELRDMAVRLIGKEPDGDTRVLVAGLGNAAMTPDAVGPQTLLRLTVTRHLKGYDGSLYSALGCCELAAIAPGVLGQTGMESGELVKCAVDLVKPHLVVAVDALAARSVDRLSSTVQITDRGIAPGSGIGNRRTAIDRDALGCPVMGVGVPTVVDSSTLVLDALEKAGIPAENLPPALTEVLERGRSFFVSPKDCDEVVALTCRLLARALDEAFGVGEL